MKDRVKFVLRQLLIVIVVIAVLVVVFAAGLMIGYHIFGDGSSPWDILSLDKWNEIIGKLTGK